MMYKVVKNYCNMTIFLLLAIVPKFCNITNDCNVTKISNFYLPKATDKIDHNHLKNMSLSINLDST